MAKSQWGLVYGGNKSEYAENIIELLPPNLNLYDVFGGGGSISHCATYSGKWSLVHYNDISKRMATLYKWKTELRKFPDEVPNITREEPDNPYNYFWTFKNTRDQHYKRYKNLRLGFDHLEVTSLDYKDIKFSWDSTIYLDPPNKCECFNHDEFYDWIYKVLMNDRTLDVFLSEYSVPNNDRLKFEVVWRRDKERLYHVTL